MRNALREKRGIFFTSIAILISAVLIAAFSSPVSVTTKEQIPLTQAKADAVNAQARDLKYNYLPQSLSLASYSAFAAMAEYLSQRGEYFQGADATLKFDTTLKEMILNGTMCCGLAGHLGCDSDNLADVNNPSIHEGVDQCIGGQIMANKNFTKRLRDVENASSWAYRINITFFRDYNNMALTYFQDNETGPWMVGVNLTVNYSITAGSVMINLSENITTRFSITGIQDPLYLVESQRTVEDGTALYSNVFNSTNLTGAGSWWNISTFYHEVEWRLYAYDGNASSFLMRFHGQDDKSPCCGIESLINPATMTSVNGALEKPYVDWCYYGPANRCTTAQIGAMWNVTCITTESDGTKFFNFALDTYHALKYNLTSSQTDYTYGSGPPPACPETPFP